MMLLAVFAYLALSTAPEVSAACTDCVKGPNLTCFSVTLLHTLHDNFHKKYVVNKMEILYKDNIIFYSYEPAISDPEYSKISYLNLDQPDANGTLSDPKHPVRNFGPFTIDQDKSSLYVGSPDGIFTYDHPSKQIARYSSFGDEIQTLFYKDDLYIVKSNDSKLLVKKGDTFNVIFEEMPVKNFVINKDSLIVYLSRYGLFATDSRTTVWLSKNAFFRGLTIDLDGVVYAWWIDEIYKVNIAKNLLDSTLVKIIEHRYVTAMTFDHDNNIIFVAGRSLNKLTPTNASDCYETE